MKCLLLNSAYEGLSFISENRGLKLYFNDKVEIVSNWNEEIRWVSGSMKIPSIIKLKYYIRFIPKRMPFNRLAVFRRDLYVCQYCRLSLKPEILTIDHILPKSRGGVTNWLNCVTSCGNCNRYKNNQTPEEAGMVLINKPYIPELKLKNFLPGIGLIHEDWNMYLK